MFKFSKNKNKKKNKKKEESVNLFDNLKKETAQGIFAIVFFIFGIFHFRKNKKQINK